MHARDPERLDIIASGVWVMAHPPVPIPTVVLVAGVHGAPGEPPDPAAERLWSDRQREQARVLGAQVVSIPEANHFLHQDRPDLVIAAIARIVEAVRHPETWTMPAPAVETTSTPGSSPVVDDGP
jgi:pimeloyl-ACP methyl ester carboxylesterase